VPISKALKEIFEDFTITFAKVEKNILGKKIMSGYTEKIIKIDWKLLV